MRLKDYFTQVPGLKEALVTVLLMSALCAATWASYGLLCLTRDELWADIGILSAFGGWVAGIVGFLIASWKLYRSHAPHRYAMAALCIVAAIFSFCLLAEQVVKLLTS
ncbi:MAG: hypothetical protein ACK4I8_03565 [Armatimonadota bacterium]